MKGCTCGVLVFGTWGSVFLSGYGDVGRRSIGGIQYWKGGHFDCSISMLILLQRNQLQDIRAVTSPF